MLNVNSVYSFIRKLAKSDYYSTLFAISKEYDNYKIFRNEDDFTDIQIIFLKYLSFYSSLYLDIEMKEVSDIVLKDEIYEDAYAMYKNKKNTKKDTKKEEKTPGTKWLFKKPRVGNQ